MRIVGKKYFSKLPQYTVYALCDGQGNVESSLRIKGGVSVYNGKFDMDNEIILCPNFIYDCEDINDEDWFDPAKSEDHEYKSEIVNTDTNLIDFKDSQKFLILSLEEVFDIITELKEAYDNLISGNYKVRNVNEEFSKMVDIYSKMKSMGIIK